MIATLFYDIVYVAIYLSNTHIKVIAEMEMMKAAESIEKAAKRLEDIKKKKNEDSQQVKSCSPV